MRVDVKVKFCKGSFLLMHAFFGYILMNEAAGNIFVIQTFYSFDKLGFVVQCLLMAWFQQFLIGEKLEELSCQLVLHRFQSCCSVLSIA